MLLVTQRRWWDDEADGWRSSRDVVFTSAECKSLCASLSNTLQINLSLIAEAVLDNIL